MSESKMSKMSTIYAVCLLRAHPDYKRPSCCTQLEIFNNEEDAKSYIVDGLVSVLEEWVESVMDYETVEVVKQMIQDMNMDDLREWALSDSFMGNDPFEWKVRKYGDKKTYDGMISRSELWEKEVWNRALKDIMTTIE